jgi:hypothetical protein
LLVLALDVLVVPPTLSSLGAVPVEPEHATTSRREVSRQVFFMGFSSLGATVQWGVVRSGGDQSKPRRTRFAVTFDTK